MFGDVLKSGDLSWRLAVRDIKAQYRQSFLGILWAFITPLVNTMVWIFLNATGLVNVPNVNIPYPLYVFIGTTLWSVLIESLMAPLMQTQNAHSIISKINFPKEALIVSGIYKTLFNTGIKMLLILLSLLFFDVHINGNILFFPLGVFSLILIGTAMGLLLTPVGMLYSDVGRAVPLGMQVLMYLCPVVYAIPETGRIAAIINLNPLTPVIASTRNWITGFSVYQPEYYFWSMLFFIMLFFFGWMLFRVSIPIIVERASS